MNTQMKLLCLSLAAILTIPLVTVATASTSEPRVSVYNGNTRVAPNHYPVIDHCAIDKDRRIFYIRVDNQGSSDEWAGISITYYRQITGGPGYGTIGQDSLQGAVEGTRMLNTGEIQHSGGYDWIHTHPGQSYYMYGGRVPDDARWVVYCMPWYYDNGNHGWIGHNGPGGENERCHVCVVS
ncbi:MAG: hypothetical protein WCE81_05655 [Halobacteriota archaeon]